MALQVLNSSVRSGSVSIPLSSMPPPLNVSPTTIPGGAVGQGYSVTFTGGGGIPPYRYYQSLQVVPGLMLDSLTGVLTGKPTSGGMYNIQMNVSDSAGATGFQIYPLNITGPTPPFTLSPLSIPDGIAGKFYSQFVT